MLESRRRRLGEQKGLPGVTPRFTHDHLAQFRVLYTGSLHRLLRRCAERIQCGSELRHPRVFRVALFRSLVRCLGPPSHHAFRVACRHNPTIHMATEGEGVMPGSSPLSSAAHGVVLVLLLFGQRLQPRGYAPPTCAFRYCVVLLVW